MRVMFVKVLLHDPKEQPLMLERGFKVSPGFVTQVALTPTYVSNISWLYSVGIKCMEIPTANLVFSTTTSSHKVDV